MSYLMRITEAGCGSSEARSRRASASGMGPASSE